MEKALKYLTEACKVVADSITDEDEVNSALFYSLYPLEHTQGLRKKKSIEDALKVYYEEYYRLPLPPNVIRTKVKKRTKVLLEKIKSLISDSLVDKITYYEWIDIYRLEHEPTLARARCRYSNTNQRIDFDSYRRLRSVSRLEEMSEVTDFKTKQALLRYNVLKAIEDILNAMLKNLLCVDAIDEFKPILLAPDVCRKTLEKIEAYCMNDFIPEYTTSKDVQEVLDELSIVSKKDKVKKVLDTIYEYFAFPKMKKKDACAVVYLLFKKRTEVGFRPTLDNFSKFKNKIYEYYKLQPPTYKICKLSSALAEYDIRIENVIRNIQ